MGFLDKVKEMGKGALKGAVMMAATSYGTVTVGKHQLCKVCMNDTHDKLVFIKVTAVEAEYTIKDDVKTFWLYAENESKYHHQIKVEFNDGETCVILLTVDQNQGSGLSSAAERLEAHYRNAGKVVEALAKNVPELSDETKQWVNKIMRYCGKGNLF